MVFSKLFRRSGGNKTSAQPDSANSNTRKSTPATTTEQLQKSAQQLTDAQLQEKIASAPKAERATLKAELLSRRLSNGNLPESATDEALQQIALLCSDINLATHALDKLQNESLLAGVATDHDIAQIRLTAAMRLSRKDHLQSLLSASQGRDKAVYRHCKSQLNALQQAEAAESERQQKISQLSDQLEHLIRHADSPDFAGRYQVLQTRWEALKDKTSDDEKAALTALLSQAEGLESARRQAEAKAQARAEATEQRQRVINRIQTALDNADQPSGTWAALMNAEKQAWDFVSAEYGPEAQETSRYEQQIFLCEQTLSALQRREELEIPKTADADNPVNAQQAAEWLSHIDWPEKVKAPEWLQTLQQVAKQKTARPETETPAENQRTNQRELDAECLKQIAAVSENMDQALEDGNASEAGRLDKRLHKLLEKLSPQARSKAQGNIRLLNGRLRELRDWQGFAVTPKKEALCDRMEALAATDHPDPAALADQIRSLQQAWKDLGYSGNDKPLWERFHSASEKAYEPCKAYFAEQDQLKARMLEKRESLISELDHYETALDWDSADLKTVQATLDAARETFRSLSPVDAKAHNRSHKAFRAVCDRIYAHIKAEYDRNLEKKKALVTQAAAATELEDISEAADTIKKLQQDWKAVGMTPRGPDQRLWAELRTHADAVFSRLGEQRDARKASIDAVVAEGEALLKAAREAVSTDADNARTLVDEAGAGLAGLSLPKSAAQRLSKELSQLQQSLRDSAARKEETRHQASWQKLIAVLEQADNEAPADLPVGIEPEWFNAAGGTDMSAQELCIHMEVLADQDSPASDQAARMAIQVKRLAEGLGKGVTASEERSELIRQWLQLKDTNEPERLRFTQALKASL